MLFRSTRVGLDGPVDTRVTDFSPVSPIAGPLKPVVVENGTAGRVAILDVDGLLLLRDHAEAGNYEILREYGLQAQDVDVMSHLSPVRKLKPKTLSTIKKWLNQSPSQNSSS